MPAKDIIEKLRACFYLILKLSIFRSSFRESFLFGSVLIQRC